MYVYQFCKKEQNDFIIGMNFDNNGMKYTINTRNKDWFLVFVDTGKYKARSFDIHKPGVFFNNLTTEENELGVYKRGRNMIHSTRFLTGIINGSIDVDTLAKFFEEKKITNVPDWSTHHMIVDAKERVWIIEPGIGNQQSSLSKNDYKVMSNFSLLNKTDQTSNCPRYNLVKQTLSQGNELTVERAFDLLAHVKQEDQVWKTAFSFVYQKSTSTIFYCSDQKFHDLQKYEFSSL